MRFSRGVVKIPIKYLYVLAIVTSTAFLLYLRILSHHRNRSQGQCRVFAPSPSQLPDWRRARQRTWQNHSVCQGEPAYTRFEDCPHCFRPSVQNLSRLMYQVQYSTSMFPRGPPNLFKPRNEVQQELITDYLITPTVVCTDTCPYLVAVLLSVTDESDQRDSIRATWGSVMKTHVWPSASLNADMQIVFVLGHQTELSHINRVTRQTPSKYMDKETYPTLRQWNRIKSEAERHGDILYLNMQDSYYNLTLKLLSSFKWVNDHCSRTKFFLKVDTDTFVSVPLLLDLLIFNEERLEYSVLGKMFTNERIVRRASKWAVDPQVYPPPLFPVYAAGCSYIISRRSFSRIVELSPYMALEDMAGKLNIPKSSADNLLVTGVFGLVLSFDYFSASSVFSHHDDREWSYCDIIHDHKITGKTFEENGLFKMWRSFFRYYGKCWKEIPELANPKGR